MALEVKGLVKIYNKRKVVKDISLRLSSSEIIGLLGSNGAGKTTIFYMITGLIAPDMGKISLHDKDITKLPLHKRANLGIGYIPQETSIFEKLSVEDNLIGILQFYKFTKKEIKNRTEKLLEELQISHLKKQLAYSLSGGEKKRLEIARALTIEPEFILMDEPFAGVDPIAIDEINNLIISLTKRNIGILITDHNAQEVLQIANKIYLMNNGVILANGTPKQIVENPLAKNYYFGNNSYNL